MVKASLPIATVPKCWPGETFVVLASGPSLTSEDVDYCRGKARVIAVKDAVRLAPWADVLYGAGADSSQWWPTHGKAANFPGLRFTLDPRAAEWATVLRQTGDTGLELDPSGLRTGWNSTYQAANLSVHLGAKKIVLLGLDLQKTPHGPKYFYGNRPSQITSPFQSFIDRFGTIVPPLKAAGISIVNCSRVTALTSVPRMSLAEALG